MELRTGHGSLPEFAAQTFGVAEFNSVINPRQRSFEKKAVLLGDDHSVVPMREFMKSVDVLRCQIITE